MAPPRHKREPNARRPASLTGRRAVQIAAGAAVAATLPAIGLGVLAASPSPQLSFAAHRTPPAVPGPARNDTAPISRTFDRAGARSFRDGVAAQEATARAVQDAHVRKWTTVDLNLWSSASRAARQTGVLPAGKRVLVTGRVSDGRVELVIDGQSRWVTAGYLAGTKSGAGSGTAAAAGLSMAPCPDGSVEYRLTPGAVYVYRSVCHAFPQITTYGGWAPRGEHANGKALDIMTTDVALGNAIAAFLQQHAAALNLYDVIWRQHIWTPVRASEGWRFMPDRGSPTANHMNHVHVSVN